MADSQQSIERPNPAFDHPPPCSECSQEATSRIHTQRSREGFHPWKPKLDVDDLALQLAYLEIGPIEAQTYWEQAFGDPEGFAQLVRHRTKHEFKTVPIADGSAQLMEITNKETGQKTFATICGVFKRPRRKCDACRDNWHEFLCDHPLERKCRSCRGKTESKGFHVCERCLGSGKEPCSKRLCPSCTATRGEGINREDYCPEHRVAAGFPPLVKKEPCQWMVKPRIVNRKCLRESCEVIISADDHVLFFPRRSRAMCEDCGESYLEIAK